MKGRDEPQNTVGPHEPATERAVLAAVLLDAACWSLVDEIGPEVFALEPHRLIWSAAKELRKSDTPLDVRTIEAALNVAGKLERAGGVLYLTGLDLDLPDLSRVSWYVEILRDRHIRREGRKLCIEAARDFDAGEDPAERIAAMARRKLLKLESDAAPAAFVDLPAVVDRIASEIRGEVPELEFRGIDTGISELDAALGGLVDGALYTIAGSTGSGKTSLAVNIAKAAALDGGLPVAIFSLEMKWRELALRLLSTASGIAYERLRDSHLGLFDNADLSQAVERYRDSRIMISDDPGLTAPQMLAACRRLKERGGLKLVIVDYIQIVTPTVRRDSREVEVAQVVRDLKLMARDLEVPVVTMSQLSRKHTHDKRPPSLVDMRESGAIEQDSDVVMAIWHPSRDEPSRAELRILKNRHGKRDSIDLAFHGETMTFRGLDYR